jgi:hypothetical protein
MNTELERIERRTVRHWFEDGIFEMSFGVFLLLLSLLFLGLAWAPEGSALRAVLSVGLLPLFLLGGWLMKRMMRALKQRLAYPRTGYVAYRKRERKGQLARPLLIGVAAGILAALSMMLFSSKPTGFNPLPGIDGLAFALVLGFLALRSGLGRFAVLAVISAAAGTAFSFTGGDSLKRLAIFFVALSASLILSGLIGCLLYLKRNPLPEEDPR